MPKFSVGDRVRLPTDRVIVTKEFSGRAGTVTKVFGDLQVRNRASDPFVPTYMVQFEGEDGPMLVEEDWLESG